MIFLTARDLDNLRERLIAAAHARSGSDNITVVCAQLEPLQRRSFSPPWQL
jgi:serine/threonine protein phosphatase PrpC